VERSWQSKAAAFVAAIVVMASGAPATGGEQTATVQADGVRLPGRWFEEPVRRAVQGAGRRLSDPACAAVLGDFHDSADRPLTVRLGELSLTPADYARLVLFYDGSSDAPCRRPRVYAFTAPGARLVRACPRLGALAASRPGEAEAVVIHELLHTLGLGDDRGSSPWITAAVESRCLRSASGRP
jgi:hypothetical protein